MAKRMILIKLNLFSELLIRFILWSLFLWYDKADPFIREIRPEEIWKYKYPVTQSIVPAHDLWLIIFLFPVVFLSIEYFIIGSRNETFDAVKGLTLAYGLNGFLTSLLKILVGRPRPDFYYRCFPEGVGSDYSKCTGPREVYLDGRKSFPSGHSSFSFTCMVFMSLYIGRKFKMYNDASGYQSWKLCSIVALILIAAMIAISRTCDYHHHYEDIIGGTLLGTALSCLCYRLYFPTSNEVDET